MAERCDAAQTATGYEKKTRLGEGGTAARGHADSTLD
jgi:hypothetical protein